MSENSRTRAQRGWTSRIATDICLCLGNSRPTMNAIHTHTLTKNKRIRHCVLNREIACRPGLATYPPKTLWNVHTFLRVLRKCYKCINNVWTALRENCESYVLCINPYKWRHDPRVSHLNGLYLLWTIARSVANCTTAHSQKGFGLWNYRNWMVLWWIMTKMCFHRCEACYMLGIFNYW